MNAPEMLDHTKRDWATITTGELDKLPPHEQRQFYTWLLNEWSDGTIAELQADHQADHNTHIANGEVRIGRRR